jgi:hypothetical protein
MRKPKLNRRELLAASAMTALAPTVTRAQTPAPESSPGGLIALAADRSVNCYDPASGNRLFTFAIDGKATAAWATTAPGLAMVQTADSLSVVSAIDGSTHAISLPNKVAAEILPSSIQFRGSAGRTQMLIGTPDSGANTFLVDLETGERTAVIGLLNAKTPPVTLQNVAVSSDDHFLLAWDGRTTWIVDLEQDSVRTLGTTAFTFSAGFSPDAGQIVYSQQLANGKTELRLQNIDGSGDVLLEGSSDILVSLWAPTGDAMLLDDRTASGGTLSNLDPGSGKRTDLLEYTGATSILQFAANGVAALVGIEGDAGRDWYFLPLNASSAGVRLLTDLADAAVSPGFDFNADWAVAITTPSDTTDATAYAVNVTTGQTAAMIEGIGIDADVSPPQVARSGPGALLVIDSFTEYAVHFLDFAHLADRTVDLTKGGTGVIAPDASGFAAVHDLNTGGQATVIYDADGNEGVTIPAGALTWI